jgi:hypothetical protein
VNGALVCRPRLARPCGLMVAVHRPRRSC